MLVSLIRTLCLLVAVQAPQPPPAVSAASFVGTWVGVQTWSNEKPSPGAAEEQAVSITIELVDGKLVGTITPFFGGSDGASFADVQIVGDELRATGGMGKPQPAGARGQRGWKGDVKIQFSFRTEKNKLSGTADVTLADVKWLQYKFDLDKKRPRY